jgi:hypothetical protein
VDSLQSESIERSYQGFTRQKPHGGRDLPKVFDALNYSVVLNADTHPNIVRPWKLARKF